MAKLDLLGIAIVARDLIDKGWTKGTWRREDADGLHVCTEGAIQEAMRDQIKAEVKMTMCDVIATLPANEGNAIVNKMVLTLSQKREAVVFQYLCDVLHVPSIPGWNDSANRKKEEVLALFDKLIKDLESLDAPQREVEVESVTVGVAV